MATIKAVKSSAGDFTNVPREIKATFILKGWELEEAQRRIHMAPSTYFRRMNKPESLTLQELWKIAKSTGKEIKITEKGVTLV